MTVRRQSNPLTHLETDRLTGKDTSTPHTHLGSASNTLVQLSSPRGGASADSAPVRLPQSVVPFTGSSVTSKPEIVPPIAGVVAVVFVLFSVAGGSVVDSRPSKGKSRKGK